MGKKTRGRRKVEMKKMENEDQLLVTFSKRRNGVIKMANALSVLTGAQVALLVFSPSNRVYPFGTPDVNLVLDRYENQTLQDLTATNPEMLDQDTSTADQLMLNSEVSRLEAELFALRKRGNLLDQLIEKRESKNSCNMETLIQDVGLKKLEQLLKVAKEFQKDVIKEIGKMSAYFCPGNPSEVQDVSLPVMAHVDSRAPAMNDLNPNAAIPSILELYTSLGMSDSESNESAPSNNSGEVGTAGVVQFAGPSRIINDAPELTPGASSSNSFASSDSLYNLDFMVPDTPEELNLGDDN